MMNRILCFAFLIMVTVVCTAPTVQAQYIIEQTIDAGYNPWIKGQSFTPSIGIKPNPGTVATLDLTAITLYRSHQPWVGPTSRFYLNIYDGDPVNGSGVFVGSSTNSVDVAPLVDFDPMKWTFDNLSLNYTQEYWAIVSSTNSSGGFDVYCGMRESGQTDPYGGGTSIAGITTDPAGYHVKPTIDLAFYIELDLSSLISDTTTLSESTGGKVNFNLNAGSKNAGRSYLMFAGVTGTNPGFIPPPGLVTIPINWDIFTNLVINLTNTSIFQNFYGTLDSSGKATAMFDTLGPFTGGAGLNMNFAFGLDLSYWDFASNPVFVDVVP